MTTNTKADKEPSNLKRMQDRYKSEKAKTTVSETFTVKHKKTNTVLSSHDSYSAAKDAHKKLEDRSKYGIYQMKNTSDSPLKIEHHQMLDGKPMKNIYQKLLDL